MNNEFEKKWSSINSNSEKNIDESSLFVEKGKKPISQRQINLYYYFQFIKDILEKRKCDKIIEIGCGRGTMALYVAEHLNKKVSLLDSSAEAIKIAKKIFSSRNIQADYYVQDILELKDLSGDYDAVISIGLAEHIDDVQLLFENQYKILKKGGIMISLNIPKKNSIQFLNLVYRYLLKLMGRYNSSIKKDFYRNNYNCKEYKRFAENAGFRNVEITHVAPFPIFTPLSFKIDKKVAKLYRFILAFRRIFMSYPFKTNSLISQAHFLVANKE
jgi:cyclopropane fatty-acyl-phospholipid synthase-like methyltransferase